VSIHLVRRVRVGLVVCPILLAKTRSLLLAAVGDDEGADPAPPSPGALDKDVPGGVASSMHRKMRCMACMVVCME
jgi:hypothetical protein